MPKQITKNHHETLLQCSYCPYLSEAIKPNENGRTYDKWNQEVQDDIVAHEALHERLIKMGKGEQVGYEIWSSYGDHEPGGMVSKAKGIIKKVDQRNLKILVESTDGQRMWIEVGDSWYGKYRIRPQDL